MAFSLEPGLSPAKWDNARLSPRNILDFVLRCFTLVLHVGQWICHYRCQEVWTNIQPGPALYAFLFVCTRFPFSLSCAISTGRQCCHSHEIMTERLEAATVASKGQPHYDSLIV
jgi:hypothetical protein